MDTSCSIKIDSHLALSLLLEKSEGAKSGLLNFSRSKVHLKVHVPKTLQNEDLETVLGDSHDQLLPLYPFPHLPVWMLQADSTMGTG